MMLPREISNKILTVGADWRYPAGGVSQVMANYADFVFGRDQFACVVNSISGSWFLKAIWTIWSIGRFIMELLLHPSKELVHIHTASYNSFKRSVIFGRITKLFKRKLIYHIHGGGFKDFYKSAPGKVKHALTQADLIIVLSPSWMEFFQSIVRGKEIAVVNNLVAPVKIFKIRNSQDVANPINLLFLGKICQEKGIFDLLDVLDCYRDKFENKIHLHIGGNGQTEQLLHIIKLRNLENIVTFHGWIGGEEKIQLFRQCHYYILPSYAEGMPLSIIEAMSYGLPVISTRVGGIPEIVNEENGFLFSPGEKQELYDVLVRLLLQVDYTRMSERAFAQAIEFQPENVTDSLLKLYCQLLSCN